MWCRVKRLATLHLANKQIGNFGSVRIRHMNPLVYILFFLAICGCIRVLDYKSGILYTSDNSHNTVLHKIVDIAE